MVKLNDLQNIYDSVKAAYFAAEDPFRSDTDRDRYEGQTAVSLDRKFFSVTGFTAISKLWSCSEDYRFSDFSSLLLRL